VYTDDVPLLKVNFYPRDAMLAWVLVIATCLSIRPPVCPSRAGTVSKRRQRHDFFTYFITNF